MKIPAEHAERMLTVRTGFRILGLDPGLNTTGYAVIEAGAQKPIVCEAGVIRGSEDGKSKDLAGRIHEVYSSILTIMDHFGPQVIAVEQLYAHYNHPRTAILMAHARGVIFLVAAQRDLPVVSYNATRVKKTITGSGRAPKEQVQRTIQRELGLPRLPQPPDVADALAIALCHYYLQRLQTS